MESIDQPEDEPEVPRREDRPTPERPAPPPPRLARVARAPDVPVAHGPDVPVAHGPDVPVARVAPQTFGEVREIAGGFEQAVPVVLDLRSTEAGLADRLIDFASGLAFALGATMEEIAEHLLLITPPNARISTEQHAQLLDPHSFEV
jgi:cell division inhibitor SepF